MVTAVINRLASGPGLACRNLVASQIVIDRRDLSSLSPPLAGYRRRLRSLRLCSDTRREFLSACVVERARRGVGGGTPVQLLPGALPRSAAPDGSPSAASQRPIVGCWDDFQGRLGSGARAGAGPSPSHDPCLPAALSDCLPSAEPCPLAGRPSIDVGALRMSETCPAAPGDKCETRAPPPLRAAGAVADSSLCGD